MQIDIAARQGATDAAQSSRDICLSVCLCVCVCVCVWLKEH